MKRILLVAPLSQSPSASWKLHTLPFINKKAFLAPLHIATIAALTPEDIEVDLWDEAVHGLIDDDTTFDKAYDLVGVTGFLNHMWRSTRIARVFRKRGIKVASGGPGVSCIPDRFRDDFDFMFVGEAELTWPQFIADFLAGNPQKEYRPTAFPDMALSPAPRWGNIADKMQSSYMLGAVQTTRGCPFTCEFCNIWLDFGRRMRVKPIEQVLSEVAEQERLGMAAVLFCVDNFVGKPSYAKDLLRALIPLNNSFAKPLVFAAEMTLTIARDEEMLSLLADANFSGFLVGLETPNPESLKETRKVQNLRGDLAEECLRAMTCGVQIDGSMILGFDNDTPDIFEQQFEFLQQACIPVPRMHVLKAIPGTELWTRMEREGRIIELEKVYEGVSSASDYVDAQVTTNILPKKMTRKELLLGYADLLQRVYDWDNFAARVKGFIANVKQKPGAATQPPALSPSVFGKLGLPLDEKALRVGTELLTYTKGAAPSLMPKVLGLCARNFVEAANVPTACESIQRQVELDGSHSVKKAVRSLNIVAGAY